MAKRVSRIRLKFTEEGVQGRALGQSARGSSYGFGPVESGNAPPRSEQRKELIAKIVAQLTEGAG